MSAPPPGFTFPKPEQNGFYGLPDTHGVNSRICKSGHAWRHLLLAIGIVVAATGATIGRANCGLYCDQTETIRDGPVTHSGRALKAGFVFQYDDQTQLILMPAELWRELSALGP